MNLNHELIKLEAQKRTERVTAEAELIRTMPSFRRRTAAALRSLAGWLEPDPQADPELAERPS